MILAEDASARSLARKDAVLRCGSERRVFAKVEQAGNDIQWQRWLNLALVWGREMMNPITSSRASCRELCAAVLLGRHEGARHYKRVGLATVHDRLQQVRQRNACNAIVAAELMVRQWPAGAVPSSWSVFQQVFEYGDVQGLVKLAADCGSGAPADPCGQQLDPGYLEP